MIDRLQLDKERVFANDEIARYDEMALNNCKPGIRVAWGYYRGEIVDINHGMANVLWDGQVEPEWCYPRFLTFGIENQLQCLRCNHKWYPNSNNPPKVCPKCKNPYWDKPRKERK